jgi:hypothetical protein
MSHKPTTLNPGDTVIFTPKPKSLGWAAGRRVVKSVNDGIVLLECGNVRLDARMDEVELLFKRAEQ